MGGGRERQDLPTFVPFHAVWKLKKKANNLLFISSIAKITDKSKYTSINNTVTMHEVIEHMER